MILLKKIFFLQSDVHWLLHCAPPFPTLPIPFFPLPLVSFSPPFVSSHFNLLPLFSSYTLFLLVPPPPFLIPSSPLPSSLLSPPRLVMRARLVKTPLPGRRDRVTQWLTTTRMDTARRTSGWRPGEGWCSAGGIANCLLELRPTVCCRTIINTQESLDRGALFINETQVMMQI